jgi:hypothetical protein
MTGQHPEEGAICDNAITLPWLLKFLTKIEGKVEKDMIIWAAAIAYAKIKVHLCPHVSTGSESQPVGSNEVTAT